MKVLIAEDDPTSRLLLATTLSRLGYDVTVTVDGREAWQHLREPDSPRLAVVDWMMPHIDGAELCRRVRRLEGGYRYTVLLTARAQRSDMITGLEAGADDYLVKPFHKQELKSRLEIGRRVLELESRLQEKVTELEDALAHVQQLQGLLPICMHCKSVRDDEQTWHQIEAYIEKHTGANFTHSLCEPCMQKHYPEHAERIRAKRGGRRD